MLKMSLLLAALITRVAIAILAASFGGTNALSIRTAAIAIFPTRRKNIQGRRPGIGRRLDRRKMMMQTPSVVKLMVQCEWRTWLLLLCVGSGDRFACRHQKSLNKITIRFCSNNPGHMQVGYHWVFI